MSWSITPNGMGGFTARDNGGGGGGEAVMYMAVVALVVALATTVLAIPAAFITMMLDVDPESAGIVTFYVALGAAAVAAVLFYLYQRSAGTAPSTPAPRSYQGSPKKQKNAFALWVDTAGHLILLILSPLIIPITAIVFTAAAVIVGGIAWLCTAAITTAILQLPFETVSGSTTAINGLNVLIWAVIAIGLVAGVFMWVGTVREEITKL